jgi:hypothetical protein
VAGQVGLILDSTKRDHENAAMFYRTSAVDFLFGGLRLRLGSRSRPSLLTRHNVAAEFSNSSAMRFRVVLRNSWLRAQGHSLFEFAVLPVASVPES